MHQWINYEFDQALQFKNDNYYLIVKSRKFERANERGTVSLRINQLGMQRTQTLSQSFLPCLQMHQ